MKTMTNISISLLACLALAATGCQSDQKSKAFVNNNFEDDSAPRAVHSIFEQQAANAAREDGQLFASHFNGPELNSLGKQKLALISSGLEMGKVSVYLAVPKDDSYAAREAAVIAFLSERGLPASGYSISTGANPTAHASAADGLKALNSSAAASGGDASAAAGAAPTK